MPRTTITEHPLTRLANTAITFVTADNTNNHQILNDGEDVALLIVNGSASPFTATIVTPVSVDGLALPDLAVTVAAGDDAIVGPFPAGSYEQADGYVYVDAGATSALVKLAAIKL